MGSTVTASAIPLARGARKLRNVLRDRRGSATIEYALLAAFIALAMLAGLAPFGRALAHELYSFTQDHLTAPGSDVSGHGCQRVEWTDSQIAHLAHKGAHSP